MYGVYTVFWAGKSPNIRSYTVYIYRSGQPYIYVRCKYGVLGREITKYMVIYGEYIWFWPTLLVRYVVRLQTACCCCECGVTKSNIVVRQN
jgi:hypothetical protein